MFFKPKVSVTYNVRLKRVRAQFRVGDCLKSRRPPTEAIDKARDKMEEEQEEGQIEYFEVFEKKFHALWSHIRDQSENLPADKEIRFTLAQGARAYSELIVQRSRVPGHLGLISCQFSERKAKTIFFTAFVFHIVRQLRNFGIHDKPDAAQLRFIYLMMKTGQKIEHWPLRAAPFVEDHPNQKFLVQHDPDHHYVALHIFDSRLLDEAKSEKLYQRAITGLPAEDKSLTWLKDHTLEKLRSLSNKVQSVGFSLPYSLLIAYDSQYRFDFDEVREEQPQTQDPSNQDLPRWKVRVGALARKQKSDYIEVNVDATRMTAVVQRVHTKALASVKDKINSDWLLHECHKQGVVFGYEKFLEAVVEALQAGRDPAGMRIAEGQEAKPGSKPYIHECFRDPPLVSEGQSALRDRQNPRLAHAGQLIAEVRYDDGIPGRNVFGEDVHALGSAAEAKITAGEAVLLREGGRFVATKNGLIEWNGHSISVLSVYVHAGSVNLSSGNLSFEGAVVVRGDIEAGATVEVRGSLLVEGVISNALVKVGGNLEVIGGVITTDHGSIMVGGNCRAQFIENSRLQIKGSLEVSRSILNSEIICGGTLVVRDHNRGVISGGTISCWEAIAVRHLGLSQGQTTTCRIGTHYASEIRWQRNLQRWKLVQEHRELITRQVKDAPAAMGAALHQRLQKIDRLLDRLQKRRDSLEKQMSWNQNATLAVRGVLDRNVEVHAAGKLIKTGQNMQGVLITAATFHNSQINDLDIWNEFKKAWPDARLGDAS